MHINDTRVATIPKQASRTFMSLGSGNGLPDMPWHVVLIRTSDGATLGTGDFVYYQLDGSMVARDQDTIASAQICGPF